MDQKCFVMNICDIRVFSLSWWNFKAPRLTNSSAQMVWVNVIEVKKKKRYIEQKKDFGRVLLKQTET